MYRFTVLVFCIVFACDKPPAGGTRMIANSAPELAMQSIDPVTGVWESAPFSGSNWLVFPGRSQVLLEHPLGRRPRIVQCFLSFNQMPTNPALAAGDLCRIAQVDERSVMVWNDTNGNYFMRLALQ